MTGGRGGDDPPSHPLSSVPTDSSGILLRLVQNRPHTPSTDSLSSLPVQRRIHSVSRDPAVSPSISVPMNNTQDRPSLSPHHPCPPTTSHPSSSSFSPCPHNLFRLDFPHNPPRPHHQSSPPLPSDFYLPHQQINANQQQQHHPQERSKFMYGNSPIQIPNERDNSASRTDFLRERESGLVSLNRAANGYDRNWSIDSSMDSGRQIHSGNGVYGSPEMQKSGPPPGFSGAPMNQRRSVEHNVATQMIGSSSELNHRCFKGDRRISSEIGSFNGCRRIDRSGQLERPGLTAGSSLHSASDSDIDDSILNWQADMVGSGEGEGHWKMNKTHNFSNEDEMYHDECDDLGEQLVDSVIIEDGSADKKDKKKHYRRDKDYRTPPIISRTILNIPKKYVWRYNKDALASGEHGLAHLGLMLSFGHHIHGAPRLQISFFPIPLVELVLCMCACLMLICFICYGFDPTLICQNKNKNGRLHVVNFYHYGKCR